MLIIPPIPIEGAIATKVFIKDLFRLAFNSVFALSILDKEQERHTFTVEVVQ